MNSRKNQNSLLILTTLGVYLGLLVVGGAAPQAFAHSATTRNFELIDEIEVKDDLDKKPDDERSPVHVSLQNYLQDIEIFFERLRRLKGAGKFDSDRDAFEVAQTTQLPCVAANRVGSYSADKFDLQNENLRPSLESFSKLLTDGYSLADCMPNSRFGATEVTDSKFDFKLDKTGFSLNISVRKRSPQDAVYLVGDLAKTYAQFKSADASSARLRICEATTFRSENDQVFIVTHLPRAGLEPLLAINAK
ncbi:MAG: hypothetical protein ACJ72Z_04885 [Pyrinomonadaceae bacterium]